MANELTLRAAAARGQYNVYEIPPKSTTNGGAPNYNGQDVDGFVDIDGNRKLSKGDIEIRFMYSYAGESCPAIYAGVAISFTKRESTVDWQGRLRRIGAIHQNAVYPLTAFKTDAPAAAVRESVSLILEQYYQSRTPRKCGAMPPRDLVRDNF